MLSDTIRRFLGMATPTTAQEAVEAEAGVDPLHLAACVLLLDVAHADGEFSDEERAHIEDVLERHFTLPKDAGRALMELADKERSNAVDY
jgi:uncharacterized tellurite resistance protein B-like protein